MSVGGALKLASRARLRVCGKCLHVDIGTTFAPLKYTISIDSTQMVW